MPEFNTIMPGFAFNTVKMFKIVAFVSTSGYILYHNFKLAEQNAYQ